LARRECGLAPPLQDIERAVSKNEIDDGIASSKIVGQDAPNPLLPGLDEVEPFALPPGFEARGSLGQQL